jgi:nucleoside-diphosphate-sugar epimerase
MKILITGATGYIGHRLALTLAERGNEIHILVRNSNSPNIPMHENIKVFSGDITDIQSITAAIKECKQVYHTAALVKIFDKDSSQFHKVNIDGTLNLLLKAVEFGIEKFLLTSSCSVIGPSTGKAMNENDLRIIPFECDYDITKLKAENLVKEYAHKGLFTVIVSPSKVYGYSGPETKAISINKMIHKFINGGLTFIPMPSNLLANYSFIDDVVEGHILAMNKGNSGENYILGGENISFIDFFHTIRSLSGTKARLIEIPKFIVKILALMQWIQYYTIRKEPYITGKSIKQIFCNKIFSSEKAVHKLGYQITPIREGLQQTIHFLKNQSHEK